MSSKQSSQQQQTQPPSDFQLQIDVAGIKKDVTYLTQGQGDLKSGQDAILKRMDDFTFVPQAVVDKLRGDFENFKTEVNDTYRKKEDGKTLRAVAVSVVTALAITMATIILQFVLKGGFNGSV